ncbi:MAG TPA: ROK family protein [Polyangiaceae bacterium]|jgi:polyphosphate glucokinase
MRTLAIDIGGTGLKALVLDDAGKALTERARIPTPRPATPAAVLRALVALAKPLAPFDRVSAGFPGVVFAGVVKTAPNLHVSWRDTPLAELLARKLGKPARVLNDAGVQGFGVIRGKGLEMVLTLGTGLGCALFYDGVYIPNLELAHHPFRKGKTYEELLGVRAFERDGKKKWNKHVAQALALIEPVWNPDRVYLGGGNVKHLKIALPPNVTVTSNVAGLLGGIALWDGRAGGDQGRAPRRRARKPAP